MSHESDLSFFCSGYLPVTTVFQLSSIMYAHGGEWFSREFSLVLLLHQSALTLHSVPGPQREFLFMFLYLPRLYQLYSLSFGASQPGGKGRSDSLWFWSSLSLTQALRVWVLDVVLSQWPCPSCQVSQALPCVLGGYLCVVLPLSQQQGTANGLDPGWFSAPPPGLEGFSFHLSSIFILTICILGQ